MRLEHCTVPSSDMFRPPINRAMRALDRSFFKKRIPLAAAQVLNIREIAKCQTQLKSDLLNLDRLANVRTDPVTDSTRKVLLLRPEIKTDGTLLTTIALDPSADALARPNHMGP